MNLTRGGRNLLWMGLGAIFISVITTVLSLVIYRTTGDIYLDRSRPGYLPDEQEVTAEAAATTDFDFLDSGPIDQETLNEYLQEYKKLDSYINALEDPYGAEPLSDESLGITGEGSSTDQASPESTSEATDGE